MQPANNKESYQAKFETYDTEIENGIFNMVVSLCNHKASTVGMEMAKEQVANWLERIIKALREEEQPINYQEK